MITTGLGWGMLACLLGAGRGKVGHHSTGADVTPVLSGLPVPCRAPGSSGTTGSPGCGTDGTSGALPLAATEPLLLWREGGIPVRDVVGGEGSKNTNSPPTEKPATYMKTN